MREVNDISPTLIVPNVSPSLMADISGLDTNAPNTSNVNTTTTWAIALFSIFTPLLKDKRTTPKSTGISAVLEEVAKYPHPPTKMSAAELIKCAVYAFMFLFFCKVTLKVDFIKTTWGSDLETYG